MHATWSAYNWSCRHVIPSCRNPHKTFHHPDAANIWCISYVQKNTFAQASRHPNPKPRTWLFSYGTHFSIQKPINHKPESKFHSNSQPYEPYCGACAAQLTGTEIFSRSKQWEEEQTATKEKEYRKQTTQVVCHNRDWSSFFFLYQRKSQLICHKHVFIF